MSSGDVVPGDLRKAHFMKLHLLITKASTVITWFGMLPGLVVPTSGAACVKRCIDIYDIIGGYQDIVQISTNSTAYLCAGLAIMAI